MDNLFREPTIMMSSIRRYLNNIESNIILANAQGLSLKAAETIESIPGTVTSIDFDYERR